jgi:hypothetical protein
LRIGSGQEQVVLDDGAVQRTLHLYKQVIHFLSGADHR